ncbi:Uncharacterised protein [Citrobacter koseri]|nr:Uncharacterised protein [Citrobacter koseri]
MNSIFYSIITLLLLTGGVLFLMHEFNKQRSAEASNPVNQAEPLSKEEGEDHFSSLMNTITPVWYWRVNHEYIDFLHATIKRMTMAELNGTPGLFDAQRRCSDLNSAVYKYYDNIKKRCLNGKRFRIPIWMCLTCGNVSGNLAWRRIPPWLLWCGLNISGR